MVLKARSSRRRAALALSVFGLFFCTGSGGEGCEEALIDDLFGPGGGGTTTHGCTSDFDCDIDEDCIDGTCLATFGCLSDFDCAPGQTCNSSGNCVGTQTGCFSDQDCDVLSDERCVNGQCTGGTSSCIDDIECPINQFCINGQCVNGKLIPAAEDEDFAPESVEELDDPRLVDPDLE